MRADREEDSVVSQVKELQSLKPDRKTQALEQDYEGASLLRELRRSPSMYTGTDFTPRSKFIYKTI